MKHEKIPGFTHEDKRDDALQKSREEKLEHKGLKDTQKEYLLDENEQNIVENDPEKNYFVDVEDLLEEQSFSNQLKEFDIEDDSSGFLEEFENEDITKGWRKEEISENDKEEELKSPGEFSMQEFVDMQNCARFKDLLEKSTLFDKKRPTFTDGSTLTNEEIAKEAQAYKECKEKNDWKSYSPFEINFMKKCSAWDYFYSKIKSSEKYPTDPNGNPMSEKDIEALANEYNEFKKTDPETFAKYKVENGEWIYDNFNWKEKEHQGKKQYQNYRKIEDGDKNKVVTIKYIIDQSEPVDQRVVADPKTRHYFSVKREFQPREDLILRILKVQKV